MNFAKIVLSLVTPVLFAAAGMTAFAEKIVFLAGDDEYRSEESLPMLAAILERDFGFETTVGYSVAEDGSVDPRVKTSLTRTEALSDADLMVWFLRFRTPDDAEFQRILDALDRGCPVVAFRTSTHAFRFPRKSPHARWNWNHGKGDDNAIRQLLGQTWISHHGSFGEENPGHLTAVAPVAGYGRDWEERQGCRSSLSGRRTAGRGAKRVAELAKSSDGSGVAASPGSELLASPATVHSLSGYSRMSSAMRSWIFRAP